MSKTQAGVAHFEYDMVVRHTVDVKLMIEASWTPIDPKGASELRDLVCEHYGVRRVALQFTGVSAAFRQTKAKGWGITLPRYTLNHEDRQVTPLRLLNVEAVLHELAHYLMWDRRGDGKLADQHESAHKPEYVALLDDILMNWDKKWRQVNADAEEWRQENAGVHVAAQVKPIDEEKKARMVAEMKERRQNR